MFAAGTDCRAEFQGGKEIISKDGGNRNSVNTVSVDHKLSANSSPCTKQIIEAILRNHGGKVFHNIRSCKFFNRTSLFLAALSRENQEVVKWLVDQGEDVNKPIKEDGTTPLLFMVRKNAPNMCSVLISLGANVSQATYDGMSPIHTAAIDNRLELVNMLLDNQANVNTFR